MYDIKNVSLLDGANNFRDLGGLKTDEGRTLSSFKIFKSVYPHR
jgi:hypothetical protein